MSFYDRFQLLDLIRDNGIRTFRAREIATGRLVEAHLITPESPETLKILLKLDFISPDEKWRVLERGDHEGTTFILTEPLADYPGFREWLVANSRPPASKPEETHDPEKRRLDTEGGWRIVSPGPLDPPEPAAHTLALPTFQPRPETASSQAAPARPQPPEHPSQQAEPLNRGNPDTNAPHTESWSAAAAPTVALRLPRSPATSRPDSRASQSTQSPPRPVNGRSTHLRRNVLLLVAIVAAVASLVAFVALR